MNFMRDNLVYKQMTLLEHIFRELLEESTVSPIEIGSAIDNRHRVIINYHSKGKDEHTGARVIEVYAYGQDKNSHDVIRAFEPYGDTTTIVPHWKFFRTDRISSWKETGQTFNHPPSPKYGKFNPNGDKTMVTVHKIVSFKNAEVPQVDNATNPKQTSGEKSFDVGKSNLELLKSPITMDMLKTSKAFDTKKEETSSDGQTTGPKPTQPEKDIWADVEAQEAEAEAQKQAEMEKAWQEKERREKMDIRNLKDRERRWKEREETGNMVHDDTEAILNDIEKQKKERERERKNQLAREKRAKKKEYMSGQWVDQNAETMDESVKKVLSLMERIEKLDKKLVL